MRTLLLVALGGSVGAAARYLLSGWVQGRVPETTFPYGTLVVNVVGCLLIGALTYLGVERGMLSPQSRWLLFTGFLGGLTTFSTFGNETLLMARGGQLGWAALNVAANNVLSLLAVWAGYSLPERFFG